MFLTPAAPPVNTNPLLVTGYAAEWLRAGKLMNWVGNVAYDGTLTDAPLTLARDGWGRSFNGISDQIVVTGAPVTAYPFTLMIRGVYNGTAGVAITLTDNTTTTKFITLRVNVGVVRLNVRNDASVSGDIDGTTAIASGDTVSLASVLRSATERRVFVNGRFEISNSVSVPMFTPNRLALGALVRTTTAYYAGIVTDAWVISGALSDAEIAAWHVDPWAPYRQTLPVVFLSAPAYNPARMLMVA